jgi:hypothetical protein
MDQDQSRKAGQYLTNGKNSESFFVTIQEDGNPQEYGYVKFEIINKVMKNVRT